MTPIHWPFRARDLREAIRPTRVSTESKTSLAVLDQMLERRCDFARGSRVGYLTPSYGTAIHILALQNPLSPFSTYTSSAIRVLQSLRSRVLLDSLDDGVGHCVRYDERSEKGRVGTRLPMKMKMKN